MPKAEDGRYYHGKELDKCEFCDGYDKCLIWCECPNCGPLEESDYVAKNTRTENGKEKLIKKLRKRCKERIEN